MSRRQQTTATFTVRIVLPVGVTCTQAQQYIEGAVVHWGGGGLNSAAPFSGIEPRHVTVALTKRETTYGNV